jgi:demethylmenaquinone methyltransferase/2-methoxy-6-polyprenyl-1,4-benzoquinol methylase
MSKESYDRLAFLYNFIVKYIIKDYKSSLRLVDRYLEMEKDNYVIDIGGGTGLIAKRIIDDVRKVMVVDQSGKMLGKIKHPDIPVLQGDGSILPLKENTFDIAIMIDAMHHIYKDNQRSTIDEVRRILKKGGMIFIIEPSYNRDPITNFFVWLEQVTSGKTYHIKPETMEEWLKKAGFNKVNIHLPKGKSVKYTAIAVK